MEVLKVFPGSVSTCVKVLNEGNLLAISPGGVREGEQSARRPIDERKDAHSKRTLAVSYFCTYVFLNLPSPSLISSTAAQFGTEYYELVWSGRVGFAKVAKQAQVPIIPIFTQNIREAFRTVQLGQGFFRWLYDKYRLPLAAIYGGFPVKLTTYIGKPIMVDPDWTPEEISLKVSCRGHALAWKFAPSNSVIRAKITFSFSITVTHTLRNFPPTLIEQHVFSSFFSSSLFLPFTTVTDCDRLSITFCVACKVVIYCWR